MILRFAICCLMFQQLAAFGGQLHSEAEQAVLAAYRRMEEADRRGDGPLWFTLRDRRTLDSMDAGVKESIRKGLHSRPSVQYEVISLRVRDHRAVLAGKATDPQANTVQYATVLFVIEDQQWKVAREQWGDRPFDPFVLSAWLPPADGAFARAGSSWKRIPYAMPNTLVLGKQEMAWKMQATADEAFLYVRFEANAPLPQPGAKLSQVVARTGAPGGPPPPPPMRVRIASSPAPEFTISVSGMVSTHRAFNGKGNRFSVAWSLFVKNAAGEQVFESMIGEDSASRLLSVQGRSIDVKVPLAGLGLEDSVNATVVLEEADSVFRILPYKVLAN